MQFQEEIHFARQSFSHGRKLQGSNNQARNMQLGILALRYFLIELNRIFPLYSLTYMDSDSMKMINDYLTGR